MKINIDYINPKSREFVRSKLANTHFSQRTLTCNLYQKALVMPNHTSTEKDLGGVWTYEGNLVQASAFCEMEDKHIDRLQIESSYTKETAIYLGLLIEGWGHGITDNIKKIWFLRTEVCKNLLASGAQIIYVTNSNEELPGHIKKVISLAGYDIDEWKRVVSPTVYDEVYVPDNSFYCMNMSTSEGRERYFTKEFVETISNIKSMISPKGSNLKMYLSRKRFHNHFRDIGEERVEKEFVKKGYTAFSPETLSVEEQIGMYMSASSIVATEGSIAHNALFCNPNTEIVLLRKANYINNYQKAINELVDADVKYIDVHLYEEDNGHMASGPFYVCVTPWLEKYVGHRIPHIPYYFDWKWYIFKFRKNHVFLSLLRRVF